jgi:multidrug efflux pump subunit AcrA (membrane-fusion protein)
MSAKVELVLARHEDVLSVPLSAVVETDHGQFCWVETANGPQRCSVTLGDSNDRFVIVQSGLEEQQKVVVQPLASIAEAQATLGSEIVHTVKRGTLPVTMIEQGALESANNTLVKCRVRGDSTINWVVKNGTRVKAGDELVTLENKAIEEYLHERTKYAHLSKDAAIGFRAEATVKGLAIAQYLEGTFQSQKLKAQKGLVFAKQLLHTANNQLDYDRRMHALGYQSELRVEQSELRVKNVQIELEILETKLDVLERLEKEEQLETLRGEWESAKAAANGHEEVLSMDGERMALAEKEIARCVIKAPKNGLVIYPSTAQWKDTPDIAEGETVHNDQVLLLMPDLSKMQVRFGIHESVIDQVQPRMRATVRLPNQTLSGTVTSVASVAQPSGWWTGNIVKYDAVIELPSAEGLKPGMTAEIEVTVARQENVLMIPLSAVEETDAGDFCWVRTRDGAAQRRLLTLGDRNTEFIAVDSGIEEGDDVYLNPSLTVKKAR